MTTDFVSAIAGQLVTQFQHEAREKTESSTRQAILNTRASEILTFVTPSGRQIKPEVSAEFVEALWCFARGTTFRGLELDSAVTQPILTAAENTLVELLNSDQARQVILTTIAPSDTVRENLQAHVGSETFWATREILNAAGLNPVHAIAAPILNQTSSLTHDLLASSAGFIDQNIRIGDLWDEKLEQAISNAFAVIPIWTPSSVQSRWVRLEARYAFRMGILCPILRQPCLPPLELSDVEFANLTDWEPDNTQHAEWNNLVNSLRRLQLGNNQPRPGSEADLCFRLGMRFLEGLQAPQNDTMALQWFTKALHLGDPRASAAISALKLPGHNDIQIITAEIHPKDDSKPAAATPKFQTPKTMSNDESSRCDNWFRTSSTQPSSMS